MEETKRKSIEKVRKKALSSRIMDELRREYDEGPQEITSGSLRQRKIQKKLDEIRRYEEDNFTRVTLSKKDKKALRRSTTGASPFGDDIINFGDTSFLNDNTIKQARVGSNRPVRKRPRAFKK